MIAYWINELNRSDSRLHKEDVLRQALELATLGQDGAQYFLTLAKYTYDPFTTFGIKNVPTTVGNVGRANPWLEFMTILDKLSERILTGNLARDAIAELSAKFDSEEWNTVCVPVIKKDLRAGISEKTINKIVSGTQWEIEIFSCQLATDCTDRPEMRGVVSLEPKLDGVRVLVMMVGDTVACYSRNGKLFENFGHIEAQLTAVRDRIYSRTWYEGIVFDGEVVSSSFQSLMRQARRKHGAQADDSVYNIFDIIPLPDFKRGYWNAQQRKRRTILEKINPVFKDHCQNVKVVDQIEVDLDTASGRDVLERYSRDMVSDGYEGIMIKSVEAPYECRRGTFWLKWKPTITVDLEVIQLEEGTGRNVGRLGALVCSGIDHGKEITVNVGSGFTDTERDDLWANKYSVIGTTVEILADAVTQNQDGTYSLRFPRFLRFRDDK